MQLTTIHEVSYGTEETILAACLVNVDEWVMLLSDGDVIRYKKNSGAGRVLFNSIRQERSSDGPWAIDLAAQASLYALGNVVVLVNDYLPYGYVSNALRLRSFKLYRDDYEVGNSKFPILLLKDKAGSPCLFYGTACNELHVMNADTLQVFTVAKSLIEDGAEYRHRERLLANPELDSNVPWPAPFDYFYGELIPSPDGRKFLSKGWVWGSRDQYLVFDIADFISNNRIKYQTIGNWEHCNRAACWVDNATIAIAFNAGEEDELGLMKNKPTELHFYDIRPSEPVLTKKMAFDMFEGTTFQLFYSRKNASFVAFTKEKGVTVVTAAGQIIFRDPEFRPDHYYPEQELFLSIERRTVLVHSF